MAIFHSYVKLPEGSWENGWTWTKRWIFQQALIISGMWIYNQRTLWVVLRYEYIIVYIYNICNYIYIIKIGSVGM